MFHCSSITITMGDFPFHQKALILHENNMDYHQDNPTLFFTIINNTNQLKVPEKLLKHLNEDLSSNAVLIGPSGDEWQVTIMKKGKNVYMQNGWSQFLKDNSVVLDEFLLFTYHGGNCFHVQIFGANGLERLCLKEAGEEQTATPQIYDVPFSNEASLSNGCGIKKTRQEQDATPSLARTNKSKQRKTIGSSVYHHESKTCQEDLPFSNTKKKIQKKAAPPSLVRTNKNKQRKSFVASSHLHESKSYQKDKALLSKDFPKPLNAIKIQSLEAWQLAESFTSRNPLWKHLMTKCNVEDQCTLPIATEFARKYIPEGVKEIILWNSEGNFWKVAVCCFGCQNKRYTRLTTGWGRFVSDNKLMKGDTCIFELEDQNHLSVHIFRTNV